MHSLNETCSANYEGSSDKMEIDEVIEMFKKFEDLYEVKYLSMMVIVKHTKATLNCNHRRKT